MFTEHLGTILVVALLAVYLFPMNVKRHPCLVFKTSTADVPALCKFTQG